MKQKIRFCETPDDVGLAYAVHGSGPPVVRAATWLTHLEFDWESPLWRHWLEDLGEEHTLIRYDERGCGLSDRDVEELSFEASLRDLETVIDAAGIDRAALLGISHGGPIAIAYAVKHPERVSHLVLYGTFARGRLRRNPSPRELEETEMLVSLIRVGWGQANPAFRHVFTTLFVPDATPEQMTWFDELQRKSTSAENAVRIRESRNDYDVTALAGQVSAPTLIMHARDDAVVPFAEGRLLATLIPTASFVPLEGRNHILLADERAWETFLAEFRDFLGPRLPAGGDELEELSTRELQVLELVAYGLSNEEIAARLYLSVRTVERHLSNIYAKLRVSGKSARAAASARFSRFARGAA